MSTEQIAIIVTGVVTLLVVGAIILYLSNSKLKTAKEILGNAETDSKRILEDSKRDAEALKKEAALEAKDEAFKLKSEAEKEVRERRSEVQRLERRTIQKEEALDKKMEQLEKKEENLAKKVQDLTSKETEAEELLSKRREELERIASLSQEDAKQLLMSEVRGEVQRDLTMMVKEMETKAKEEADKKAREIITTSIQRCAADHVSETTVHVVSLPNDEMKGRIIGREGRNIRTLETLTGVDLIIDDTPEAVILSSFDPIRREVAKLTLEKLIVDGRIHPARIEEMVEKAQREVEVMMREEGEAATLEVG
ncbi:Rnase Y domain-containing protein, partial [Proteiniclasticum sp.]|uniref:Rnase Y domain-containing protein n=1 Tax=Proteiniclasticum sp. TaxID=2053595 RepID=UPI0028A1B75F